MFPTKFTLLCSVMLALGLVSSFPVEVGRTQDPGPKPQGQAASSTQSQPKAGRPAKDEEAVAPQAPGKDSEKSAKKNRLPTGPTPVQAIVSLDKEGRLVVVTMLTTHELIEGDGPASTGKQVKRVERETTNRYRLKGEVHAYDTRGKEIDPGKLGSLVGQETHAYVAFVFADEPPVDPRHLRLCKEGTLLFVVPPFRGEPPVGSGARPAHPRDRD